MLRPREVCERLGISYATLREYVKRGWIKPVVLESGRWRFREEDVERLAGIVKPRKAFTASCYLFNLLGVRNSWVRFSI